MKNLFSSHTLKHAILVTISVLMIACSTTNSVNNVKNIKEKSVPSWTIAAERDFEVIDTKELFFLSDTQRERFLNYYNSPVNSSVAPHKRLSRYLENILVGFRYDGTTLNAQDALQRQEGNCMSLAVLTSALSQIVDLPHQFQEVITRPIFHRKDNTILSSMHLRTRIYDHPSNPESQKILGIPASVTIDYFPSTFDIGSRKITHNEFIAMYFRNLAAKHYVEGDIRAAYEYSANSMLHAPKQVENINQHALIMFELGATNKALALYSYGESLQQDSINLLNNYVLALKKTGQFDLAKEMSAKLLTLKDPSPYRWINLGNEYLAKHQNRSAVSAFKRAVSAAHYLDEGYLGLARAYNNLGEKSLALENVRLAKQASINVFEEEFYIAKLSALKSRY